MNRTSLFLSFGAALIVAGIGCQAIANLDSRNADPVPGSGCHLPGVAEPENPKVVTPSTGNGRVRLVNVANVAGNTDFCIRPSGTTSWGRPIFRDGGSDGLCLGTATSPGGLAYASATVPFSVPLGKLDVKAIPAGQTCAVAGTSEKDGIVVADNVTGTAPVMTLMRWGGGSTKEGISALPERSKSAPPANNHEIRIINALSDGKAITVGLSTETSLPGTDDKPLITVPVVPGVAAATVSSTDSSFPVDANGYLTLPPYTEYLAAAYGGDATNKAVVIDKTPNNSDVATFFIIGDPGDTTNSGHVVRGLYCEDTQDATAVTSDAGAGQTIASNVGSDRVLVANCSLSPLAELSIDMANAALYGANAPYEQTRILPIQDAIAARTSDAMCLVEVDDGVNRANIITAALASGAFPYSYQITTNGTTPPTNPADVKPLASSPPCGGQVNQSLVDDAFSCIEEKCSNVANDEAGAGELNGTTACLSGPCIGPLGKLYTVPAPGDRTSAGFLNDVCFDCMLAYLTSELPINYAKSECTTDSSRQHYGYDGQMPSLILSRHPLQNMAAYILPSTGYRRAVLKAQMVLEDQSVVDFFCAQLSSPLLQTSLPYTGNYGSDTGPNGNGWEDEQDLQAQEAVAWIKSETAKDKLPAIVAADLHADIGSADADAGLTSLSPEVVNDFLASTSGLTAAIPSGYTPSCDYCPAPINPYNGGEVPYELMHAFVSGFPTNATVSETNWGNDPDAVTLPSGGTGPIFVYAAHNYTILRP